MLIRVQLGKDNMFKIGKLEEGLTKRRFAKVWEMCQPAINTSVVQEPRRGKEGMMMEMVVQKGCLQQALEPCIEGYSFL